MEYQWYQIFDYSDFLDTGLVNRTLEVEAPGRGTIQVLLTRGNEVSFTYEGTLLPVNFLGRNPYHRDGKGVFLDIDGKVWLGFEVPQ
jgi:hypothetical protein